MSETDSQGPEAAPSSTPPHSANLAEALARRAISLDPRQVTQLEAYARLLWEWNERLNLTRHTTWDRFASRDVVDSLALAAQLAPGERVLDVGTGGGVPGIVLAIVRPDLQVALVESVAKKARAVSDIVARLGQKVPVHHDAVQNHLRAARYDVLVIRAVARLAKLLEWLGPRRASFGRLLLVKGPAWVDERGEARHRGLLHGFELRKLSEYPMEGADGPSVVLELRPEGVQCGGAANDCES